jgi:ADP-heptose:LPS heptosyltransferase
MQVRFIKQQAQRYLSEYRTRAATLSSSDVSALANQAVSLFFAYYQTSHAPLREAIELLCEINAAPNPDHTAIGLTALFPNLIEKLNDAFLPSYCQLYDRVFAQVISFFRQLPEGKSIDTALTRFGLPTEAALLRRKRILRRRQNQLLESRPLKKILFLSRVTIGADVAVTSVMMAHLKSRFPPAELVLLGSPKLQQLYGGDARIRVRPVDYGRGSNLLSRLESWQHVLNAVQEELSGLAAEEYCVIDPDSRLTQLGLLPVLSQPGDEKSYYLFEGRGFTHSDAKQLGQLASHWVNLLCGTSETSFPFVALPADQSAFGQQVCQALKAADNRPVICLSFGVGGNAVKRVSELFEAELVVALAQKARLIIDCGATSEENEQIERLTAMLAARQKTILSLNDSDILPRIPIIRPDILTWQGSLGIFAALIAGSNLYIGYDSAGQHIAAALSVPTLTIFVNSGSNHFPDRWQPHGTGTIKTLRLAPSHPHTEPTLPSDFLAQVLKAQEQLLLL